QTRAVLLLAIIGASPDICYRRRCRRRLKDLPFSRAFTIHATGCWKRKTLWVVRRFLRTIRPIVLSQKPIRSNAQRILPLTTMVTRLHKQTPVETDRLRRGTPGVI